MEHKDPNVWNYMCETIHNYIQILTVWKIMKDWTFLLFKGSNELTVNFKSGSSSKHVAQWYKLPTASNKNLSLRETQNVLFKTNIETMVQTFIKWMCLAISYWLIYSTLLRKYQKEKLFSESLSTFKRISCRFLGNPDQ